MEAMDDKHKTETPSIPYLPGYSYTLSASAQWPWRGLANAYIVPRTEPYSRCFRSGKRLELRYVLAAESNLTSSFSSSSPCNPIFLPPFLQPIVVTCLRIRRDSQCIRQPTTPIAPLEHALDPHKAFAAGFLHPRQYRPISREDMDREL